MEKTINLDFAIKDTSIVGDELGRDTFTNQVKPKMIDYENLDKSDVKYIIKFPDSVELITSSFVQGFTHEIVSDYGVETFLSHFIIEGVTPDIKDDFYGDL